MLYILTLTWQGKDKIITLKNSLLPALDGIEYTWAIKDNGSTDGTIEEIESWSNPNIKLFDYHNNLQNYSEGNNWLFLRMPYKEKEDLVLLLNNDIVFNDVSSIKNMVEIFKNKEIGIVGAKLNYTDNPKLIQHCGVLYHPANIGTPFHFRAKQKEEARDRENRFYPAITGAVLLTRASIWRQTNGLDPKFQWCWDDVDFCLQVQDLGYKVVYCGQTNILHSESATLIKNPVNKAFFDQNLRYFISKWKHRIDKTLVEKYAKDPKYLLYKE